MNVGVMRKDTDGVGGLRNQPVAWHGSTPRAVLETVPENVPTATPTEAKTTIRQPTAKRKPGEKFATSQWVYSRGAGCKGCGLPTELSAPCCTLGAGLPLLSINGLGRGVLRQVGSLSYAKTSQLRGLVS